MVGERAVREMFGEFDCGCDGRREIMGSEDWQLDATWIAAAVVVTIVILVVMK